jgi:hypothetical protein
MLTELVVKDGAGVEVASEEPEEGEWAPYDEDSGEVEEGEWRSDDCA